MQAKKKEGEEGETDRATMAGGETGKTQRGGNVDNDNRVQLLQESTTSVGYYPREADTVDCPQVRIVNSA